MSIARVREFFKRYGLENKIMEFSASSATVALAAEALGVIEARIAKTLSFKKDDGCILVVTAGDAKIDNTKFKSEFSMKARMLTPEEVITLVGHEIGGVCPFGINENIPVYLDISMKRFDTIFPACGSSNSAIEFSCEELFNYSHGVRWVDVCKSWNE
jgi:prolyl-tRNA editing enzyme YbaK/EbsC (Cys-tRNA(Pro) deacylase)